MHKGVRLKIAIDNDTINHKTKPHLNNHSKSGRIFFPLQTASISFFLLLEEKVAAGRMRCRGVTTTLRWPDANCGEVKRNRNTAKKR